MYLANGLSALRLASAPLLLWLGWHGYDYGVLGGLLAALLSDMLDGYLARALGQTSALGARLDSLADSAIFLTIPLAGWWVWPDIMRREAFYFLMALGSAAVPPILHLYRFRTLTSYHTWSAKLAVLLMGSGVMVLFAGWSSWLFHLATWVCVGAALEQIVITLILPQSRSDIPSLWHVTRAKGENVETGAANDHHYWRELRHRF